MTFFRNQIENLKIKTPFLSKRLWWLDYVLFAVVRKISGFIFNELIINGRSKNNSETLIGHLKLKSDQRAYFRSHKRILLLSADPHLREDLLIELVEANRVKGVSFSKRADEFFKKRNITFVSLRRDWLSAWIYLLREVELGDIVICSSLSDLHFTPLRWHPYRNLIWFDAYDPTGEYVKNSVIKRFDRLNKTSSVKQIIRDARFHHKARQISGRLPRIFLPDEPTMATIPYGEMKNKFLTSKISFISSGWITSFGDSGNLNSLKLIKKIWPEAEIHICMTKFMSKNSADFSQLIEFTKSNVDCYIHENLTGAAYQGLLDHCQVGINLHDVNVFGTGYQDYDPKMIRRSPSSRVLDYAVRGCVLLTTKNHRFAICQFKKLSPHGNVLYLSPDLARDSIRKIANQILTSSAN